MRKTLFVMFLLCSSSSLAVIYHWTNQQGVQQYSQAPPRDKSISSEKIYIKKHFNDTELPVISLQQSADAIAKSNADRKIASDKFDQQLIQRRLMDNVCHRAKLSLAALELSGNRLYKDASGSYLRLDEEAKNIQRQKLNKQIEENCLE